MGFHHSFKFDLRPEDIFVNRIGEAEALSKAITCHRKDLQYRSALRLAATNVLVLHGIGGIGKTTLSKRLQVWLDRGLGDADLWGPSPGTGLLVTVRYDLHDAKGQVDPGAVVLSLRRALSKLQKKWPAFDLAFGAWWDAVHRDGSAPSLNSNMWGELSDSISTSITEIAVDLGLSDFVSGMTVRGFRKFLDVLIRSEELISAHEIAADGTAYRTLLRSLRALPSPDEPRFDLLLKAVELIGIELDRYQTTPTIVMFIDAFENVQLNSGFDYRGESFFNELVWRLPQVFFVITGRNVLDWGRRNGCLVKHRGPSRWPGLALDAGGASQQHQVGYLSWGDSVALLRKAIESDSLLIDEVDIRRIVGHTNGHPKHLDLVIDELRQRKAVGEYGYDEEILHSTFDELVLRLLRDVSPESQNIIRCAALFTSFTPALLSNVASAKVGAVLRALKCPLVDNTGNGLYRLHDSVRVAIRSADSSIEGGWAERDWQEAANRALIYYREEIRNAMRRGDKQSAFVFIGAAISLVATESVTADGGCLSSSYSDWLHEVVVMGPGIVPLRNLVPSTSRTEYGRSFIDFIAAKDNSGSFDAQCALLSDIGTRGFPISRTAKRHLAYALRDTNEFGKALDVFESLIEERRDEVDLYQKQYTIYMSREFEDAILTCPPDLPESRVDRLFSWVELSHGRPQAYLEQFALRVAELRKAGRLREAEQLQMLLDKWTILCDRKLPRQYLDDLLEDSYSFNTAARWRVVRALKVLNDPLADDVDEHLEHIREIDLRLERGPSSWQMFARACRAYACECDAMLSELAGEICSVDRSKSKWIPLEMLMESLGFYLDIRPAQWIESRSGVKERWVRCWQEWKVRVTQP